MKVIYLILTLMISEAQARGDEAGNGGGVHYCPETVSHQKSYQTYDLKEIQDHLLISRRRIPLAHDGTTSKREYLEQAFNRVELMAPHLASALRRMNAIYASEVQDEADLMLSQVDDVELYSVDKGCEYRQVINWMDADEVAKIFGTQVRIIRRDPTLYYKLSPLDQAALDFHEAAYAVQRSLRMPYASSSYVRLFTGQIFSEGEVDEDLLRYISLYDRETYEFERKTYNLLVTQEPCELGEEWRLRSPNAARFSMVNRSKKRVKYSFKGTSSQAKIKPNQTFTGLVIPTGLMWSNGPSHAFLFERLAPQYDSLRLDIELSACGTKRQMTLIDDGWKKHYFQFITPTF